MNELEAKKRALVAESEVYRETLKLELHNFRIYALRAKQKLKSFGRPNPLFMLLGPMAGALLKRRRSSWLRKMAMAFVSWQLFHRAAPFLRGFLSPARDWTIPGQSHAPESAEALER
jgi:hypothetical protein